MGDDGDWEGLGGFLLDEVLEVDEWLEMLLSLDGVVEAAVPDGLEGAVEQGPEVAEVVFVFVFMFVCRRMLVGLGEEDDEPHCHGFWVLSSLSLGNVRKPSQRAELSRKGFSDLLKYT